MTKAALAALALATTATALPLAAQQLKPEAQIHLRQSTMALIGYNFGILAAMAQDKRPYDKAEAERAAEIIPHLAALPGRFFGEGTESGGHTKAKPEIWKNMDDFKRKMSDLVRETKNLSDVAKGGDEAKTREQFKKTAGACKSCHDKYRSEE